MTRRLPRTAPPGRARRAVACLAPVACLAAACLAAVAASVGAACAAEPIDGPDALDGRDGRPLALERFQPRSQLVAPRSDVPRAKFPVVDIHVHPRLRFRHDPERLAEFVRIMDAHNVALCVSLDGRLGDELQEHLAYLRPYEDRFLVFANVDWVGDGDPDKPASWDCHRPGFARRTADRLADAKRQGAVGLKVFKSLGLRYRNPEGSLIAIDDPRWDPIWAACGELGLPIIIHSADPVAFFEPIDEHNERWEELRRHPDWGFHGLDPTGRPWPTHDELLAARNRVIARHPGTTFIGAHMANYPENLAKVGEWLERFPNLVVGISSRIAELGRQPYTAREFFIEHADRILFGTDGPRPAARLAPHWRFFETRDEYFPYAEDTFPPQGFWRIHGIHLPDSVLRKLYHKNAARVIPGVSEKLRRLGVLGDPQ
ncbi:amidohydrolase family protein [Botrimarina sp.]|uniref:amidohydrolase family protein n=1 Tax=Botrimarina sp. TaxID=2795802 RepID=UPI0032ED3827